LPWVTAGIFSAPGTDGDGILTLIGGVVVALIGVANRASIVAGIGTVIIAVLALLVVVNVFGNFNLADTEEAASVGSGLYLTGLASLFALIAGFKVIGQARRSA